MTSLKVTVSKGLFGAAVVFISLSKVLVVKISVNFSLSVVQRITKDIPRLLRVLIIV